MDNGNKRKWSVLIFIVLSIYSCVDTFFPQLPNKEGFLVIDAQVTDETRSYDVYITRSVNTLNSSIAFVKGAYVSISDVSGNEYVLQETPKGHYVTDSKKFTGRIGNKYILYIRTTSGVEYRSDTCEMFGNSSIDQLYIGKSTRYTENGVTELTGLSLYVNGSVSDKNNHYLKWDLNETWKYAIPYPLAFSFSPPADFIQLQIKNYYCWKNAKSSDIIVHSFQDQDNGILKNKEIAFFLTNESDRFNLRYSVMVNQYSISRKEYEFWNMLTSTTDGGGGIFERQPYSIRGNIRNQKNSDEVVLGYFQVASVNSRRLYVDPIDVARLKLTFMVSPCETKIYQIGDIGDSKPLTSLKAVYDYIVNHDSVLVMPYWNDLGRLTGMTATSKMCSDCSLTGDPNRPAFWTDATFR
jgi:hypothetical protein